MTTRPPNPSSASRWLRACCWKSHLLLAPLVAALSATSASGYTVPNIPDLLFNVNTDALVGAAGSATGNWLTENPVGGSLTSSGGAPKNDVINGVKWEKNNGAGADMFRFPGPDAGGAWNNASPIACTGATIVAAIKPLRYADGGNWNSIVDIFYDGFVLAIDNQDGQIGIWVKGTLVWTGVRIPDQQTSVVSVVANETGGFTLYVNGASALVNTTSAAMTSLVPGGSGNTAFKKYINLGRNNPDGWPCFNGNIGDVLVYKTALGDSARTALEADLMTKFKAGGSYTPKTITASSGAGTSISPTGEQTLSYEGDKTFTMAGLYGYSVEVLVDGVSQGNISSYTFNDVTADHTIAVVGTALPTRTISGHVAAAGGGGATVSVKLTGSSLPAQQTTTDASGNYSMVVPEGTYSICASQTGYMISADTVCNASGAQVIDFTLAAGRSLPQMEQLLFAADSSSLGVLDSSGNWDPLLYCTYPGITRLTAIATPTVTKVRGIKYDRNQRGTGGDDGYRLNTAIATAPIPTTGASVVTVVKPVRNATSDGWNSVVDIFRDNLILGVKNNTGQIQVRRNGTDYWSSNNAAGTLADGQLAILSLVVQPDGQFKVWCSKWDAATNRFGAASVIMSSTATSAFNAFVPAQMGPDDWRKWINVGRNNGDGWTSFNGYIGDTFVYRTALSDAERATLEADINLKTTSIPAYNITASAGPNGAISPAGVTSVGETDSQTYTITPAWGFDVADVLVDTVSQGSVTSYTFDNVTAPHTISATFIAKPTYAVSGQVTNSAGGAPLVGAKVYVSTTPNASANPLYILTTDASGNYSLPLFDGAWYVAASATGYTTAADLSVPVGGAAVPGNGFALTASGRNIPRMDQLQFSLYATALTANGATTNPWPLEHPFGLAATVGGTPTTTTVDSVKWEQNRYDTAGVYTIGTYAAPIPITGATATAVIQPVRTTEPMNWNSIIDVMYNRLVLAINNQTGELIVIRNGARLQTGVILPENQKTIVSLVVQQSGQYKVFANGIQVVDETSTSDMSALDPTWNGGGTGFWSNITLGRNAPDGWTTFNGQIGAAFLWKTTLTQGERIAFEAELGTTFGITMPVYHNITASAGAGGTISPSGVVPVLAGADQDFVITPNVGYGILNVVVDGVSMGAATNYTFPAVAETHTIAATFSSVPQYTVSGKVTDRLTGLPVGGATVNFAAAPNAFVSPYATATTDGAGTYTKTLFEGQLYVSVTKAGYYNTADAVIELNANTTGLDFSLAAAVRNTPVPDQLLFSAFTEVLPNSGNTGSWATDAPVGGSLAAMGSPTVAIGDGQKWARTSRTDQSGFSLGQITEPIPCSGATIVVVVKPVQIGVSDAWNSVVDLFYDRLVLGVRNDNGQVFVRRSGSATGAATRAIPDGQTTILSLVVKPDGSYQVFGNGVEIPFTDNGPVVGGFTSLVPGVTGGPGGFGTYVNVGRNQPDGWTVFNGNIGDVLVYKTALTQDQRMQLEQDAAAKYGITLPVYHTITASAGPNGRINPSGAYKCAEGQDQLFTIIPDSGFVVEDVKVDGESQGAVTSYTFAAVDGPHTISATFVTKPDGYSDWISFFFLPGEPEAEKSADPDGDGRINLLEYALDDDPTSAQASVKVRSRIEDVAGEKALVLTLPVLDGAVFAGATSKSATVGGVVYTIEGSNGLNGFDQVVSEVVPASAEGMEPPFAGWTYRTFRLDGAVPARGAAGFLRVRVAEVVP